MSVREAFGGGAGEVRWGRAEGLYSYSLDRKYPNNSPTLQTSVPEHFRTDTGHSRSRVSFRLRRTGDVIMHSVCIVNSGCMLLFASATSYLQPCAIDIFICSATYTISAHTRARTANSRY